MRGLVAVASSAIILSGVPAQAADEPVSVPVAGGSLTVVAPEVKWSQPGSGCEDFAVQYRMSFSDPAVTWWSISGTGGTASGAGDIVELRGTAPGMVTDQVRLCPEDVGYGSMRIAGTVRLSTSTPVAFTVPFTLTRMRTSVAITGIRGDAGSTTVRGKVRAYHPRFGWQPGEGSVRVEFKKPGSRWRGFGTTVASGGELKGRFEWTRYRTLPSGTKYRARYLEDPKQEPAVSAVKRR